MLRARGRAAAPYAPRVQSPSDNPAPLMLSVSGLRGVTGRSFTPEVAGRFARAFAALVRERTGAVAPAVAFGRDGRAGAEALRDATIEALVRDGCRVTDLGVAMTPTVGVMADLLGADGGLVLTASHNPGEWNGLKALVTGPAPVGAHAPDATLADALIRRFQGEPADSQGRAGGSSTRDDSGARRHVERVLGAIETVLPIEEIRRRRFRVVVDSVNSSGAEGARLLLDALGCDLTHVHADASGVFPHAPEPSRENLVGLRDSALAARAEVAFAQDPDADRLALLDERGAYIGEEYTLVFAARAIAGAPGARAAGPLAFGANLSTSRMIDDVAASLGASVARSPVGEANVVGAMASRGCALGGEGNGGVIWPRVCWIRDSLAAMGLALALMAREGATVSSLVAGLPAYVIEKRKVGVRPGLAQRACDAVAKRWGGDAGGASGGAASGGGGARVDTQDGVRVDFPDHSWLHVRASNTEPIIRLIAEAKTASRCAAILDDANRTLETL